MVLMNLRLMMMVIGVSWMIRIPLIIDIRDGWDFEAHFGKEAWQELLQARLAQLSS
jgi:hypothetical protein